jgi:Bacterial low temperature requirement A protein (LtrA)
MALGAAYLAGFADMIGLATPVRAAAFTITDAIIERFGLFIIIVLGETVTGVVDGLAHAELSPLTLAVGPVAIAGRLVLTAPADDREHWAAQSFDPGHRRHELSDDPVMAFRVRAYPESFRRRSDHR